MNPQQLKMFAEIEDRHWWFAARRMFLRALFEKLFPSRTSKPVVIDIGCGTGGNLGALADVCQGIGIDSSPTAIEHAQKRVPGAEFLCGDVHELGKDRVPTADLVIMMDVIEHVQDDLEFVSRVVQRMKVGANLFITVPADRTLWSAHDETVLHYRRYDVPRLQAVAANLPLKTRLISYHNYRLLPMIRLARVLSRRRGKAAGEVGTDFKIPIAPANSMLRSIFAGETRRILNGIDSPVQKLPYAKGVTLLGVFQRTPGDCPIQHAHAGLWPDQYNPQTGVRHE
ncbi:MAG TPA: class I SAM-dependent methyltransferase [Phycisphaerales bacterium]|nr:class I SAM-dependent methyltransferase [Phycisphaerales bacterium]